MTAARKPFFARPGTWVIAALLVAIAASYIFFSAWTRAGEMTTLTWRFDGTCTDVAGIAGPEDMVLDRQRHVLWVSSDDRRPGSQTVPGSIQAINFDAPVMAPAPVTAVGRAFDASFQPHGISLFVGADGTRVLFVVNHPNGHMDYSGTTVELYEVGPDNGLTFKRAIAIPGLSRINDIIAVGPDRFYATSESDAAQGSIGERLGFILNTDHTGAIWYFDGTKGTRLAGGIAFANSLAVSPDGKRLYATGTLDRMLHIYDRDTATGGLTKVDEAFIGTGLDNLDVEPDGRIWIGAHPKLFTFDAHANDPAGKVAPNQVIIVEPAADGKGGKVDQVLLQPGDAGVSGVTVAVRDGNRMVMGSVFSNNLRVCTLPANWKHSQAHPARLLIDPARDAAIKAADEAKEKEMVR